MKHGILLNSFSQVLIDDVSMRLNELKLNTVVMSILSLTYRCALVRNQFTIILNAIPAK